MTSSITVEARHDMAWQSMARQGKAKRGIITSQSRLGMVRRGLARLGKVRRGVPSITVEARRSVVRLGVAR